MRRELGLHFAGGPERGLILRGLINRITVTPDLQTGEPEISLEGNLAGILSLSRTAKNAVPVSQDDVQQVELVAGVGFEPTTFRL